METHNSISFERLLQEFDSVFEYNFQEWKKLKFLNINITQSEYGISIYQTYHTIKWNIQ